MGVDKEIRDLYAHYIHKYPELKRKETVWKKAILSFGVVVRKWNLILGCGKQTA
jgi:hypothetical protein